MSEIESRQGQQPPDGGPHSGGLQIAGGPATDRNWLPWIVASAVVVGVVVLLAVLGGRSRPAAPTAHYGLDPADPYAAKLVISNVKMSEASNFAGSKVTYVEGRLTNNGDRTVTGVTVQVAFRNDLGEIAQKESLPVMLIRAREPYVDTESVDAAPIKPAAEADFRLVFDHLADDWNQQYPELRITSVQDH
ncbi:MAG TPA: DUF2393 family protein [Acidisarcina sp.]